MNGLFDSKFYRNAYPDLANAYKEGESKQLANHFIVYGQHEQRLCSLDMFRHVYKNININDLHTTIKYKYGLEFPNKEQLLGWIWSNGISSDELKKSISQVSNYNDLNIIVNDFKGKNILLNTHSNLSVTAGDTVMVVNWLNKLLPHVKSITILTRYEVTSNFTRNINYKNYKIVKVTYNKQVIKYIDINQSCYDAIFIRNHLILQSIKNKPWLNKTTLYTVPVHISDTLKLNGSYKNIIVQSNELKADAIKQGISKDKILVIKPFIANLYKFKTFKDNKKIHLIYTGTIRKEEKIPEIINTFKDIYKLNKNIHLTIVYGKIHGSTKFIKDINNIINKQTPGVAFKHNLTHKQTCEEISKCDFGICFRPLSIDGQVSSKMNDYESYGLGTITNIEMFNFLKRNKLYMIGSDKQTSGYFQRTLHILKNRDDLIGCYNPHLVRKSNDVTYIQDCKNGTTMIRFDEKLLIRIIKILNIKYIILPSNHVNFNTAATYIKQQHNLKVKLIYEFRGLWFLTSQSKYEHHLGNKTEYTPFVRKEIENEHEAVKKADGFIFINNAVRSYLIDELKFYEILTKPYILLENSYNTQIRPNSYRKNKKPFTIGYLGTINHYEGVSNLIMACQKLIASGIDIKLVIRGVDHTGIQFSKYKFIDYADFVPHDVYVKTVSTLDLLCLPRRGFDVCKYVPALKPLAAMYLKIPIVISDFPCYREMSPDGFYFIKPDSVRSLINGIKKVIRGDHLEQKLKINHELVIKRFNWKHQCEKITRLTQPNSYICYNFKINLLPWSGAVYNTINEMICLSKFTNVFYNNIYLNDLICNNAICLDELNKRIQNVLSLKSTVVSSISPGRAYISYPSDKYDYLFYRGKGDQHSADCFMNLPGNGLKIYQHNFLESIWRNGVVGFQTDVAVEYANKHILNNKGDDGTLNYNKINVIPDSTFIRRQCIVTDCDYKRQITRTSKQFTIGIIGTIYKETDPTNIIDVINKINLTGDYNISLVIYSNNILINLPKYSFLTIDSFSNENIDDKREKMSKLDLIINTWDHDQQDYGGSNKNLDAICYNIPLLVRPYRACKEMLGEKYSLYYNDINELRKKICMCYNDINYYSNIVSYLQSIKPQHVVENVSLMWQKQLERL